MNLLVLLAVLRSLKAAEGNQSSNVPGSRPDICVVSNLGYLGASSAPSFFVLLLSKEQKGTTHPFSI